MILPFLFIGLTASMDRGVFTSEDIAEGTVIEIAPVIILSAVERKLADQTLLHDYIFEWGGEGMCCLALGYVSIYNHSKRSNCEYEMDYESSLIRIKTMQPVHAGEELFINYNGDWNNDKPVWFDLK